jgi:predicted hydrocarbon binding protein
MPVTSAPTRQMSRTVHARIPLSLLEAIRRIDTPPDQTDTEYVPELRNKRLGLSETVYTQIRRYSDAMKKGQRIPFTEAEGLGTLIGRRPDAVELFRRAGSIFAADAYESIPGPARQMMRHMPRFISRPMALKRLTGIADKYIGGSIDATGNSVSLRIPESVTVNGSTDSQGCLFYEEALSELLRHLLSPATSVEHVRCIQRGEEACEWRAEWSGHPS